MEKREKLSVLILCLCVWGMLLNGCNDSQSAMTREEPETAVYEKELEKEVLLDESGLISINLQQGEANPGEPGIMIREEHLDKGIFTSEYLHEIKRNADGILTELLSREGALSEENRRLFSLSALEQLKAVDWSELKGKWSREEGGYDCFCMPNLLWADSGYEFVYVYREEGKKGDIPSDEQDEITWIKLVVSETGTIQGFFTGEEKAADNDPYLIAGLRADRWFVDTYTERVIGEGKAERGKILAASFGIDEGSAILPQFEKDYIDISLIAERAKENLSDLLEEEKVLPEGWVLSPYYDAWYYPSYSTENEFALVYYLYPDFGEMSAAGGEALILYTMVNKTSGELSFLQTEAVFLEKERYHEKRAKIDLRFLVVEDSRGTTAGSLASRGTEENIFGEWEVEEYVERVGKIFDRYSQADDWAEDLFTHDGEEQINRLLEEVKELTRKGWKRRENNTAYYYPQNEQEGRAQFRFYYCYWARGRYSAERVLGMDVWISPDGIEEIRTEWLWREPIQEEEISHRTDVLTEFSKRDIEPYLQLDWSRDELLQGLNREIEPNGSGDGWNFSLADIDFDGIPEMLVTISYWAGGNSLYVYRQQGNEVVSYVDTYAVFKDRFYSGLDPTEISPYLNIDLLGIYVNEAGEYRYLSMDCSLHGGDIRGGWGEFVLYETKLEPEATLEEILRVSYVYPEECMELYFKGDKVYGKVALGERLEEYMDGWKPVEFSYATAKTRFARDIAGWEPNGKEEEKQQELQSLYQDLQGLVSW